MISSACDSTSECNSEYRVSVCFSSDIIDRDTVEISPDAFAMVVLSGLFCIGVGGLDITSCPAKNSQNVDMMEQHFQCAIDQKEATQQSAVEYIYRALNLPIGAHQSF